MSLLSRKDFDGVIDDGLRIRCFTKIYDLSIQAADAIDKNQSIDEYIVNIDSLVNDLVKIPRGYNQRQVTAECGQHIIDDVKSFDAALIRSKWIVLPGTTVIDRTSTSGVRKLLNRLTRLSYRTHELLHRREQTRSR